MAVVTSKLVCTGPVPISRHSLVDAGILKMSFSKLFFPLIIVVRKWMHLQIISFMSKLKSKSLDSLNKLDHFYIPHYSALWTKTDFLTGWEYFFFHWTVWMHVQVARKSYFSQFSLNMNLYNFHQIMEHFEKGSR